MCIDCNSNEITYTGLFKEDIDNTDYIFIECPGATLYEPGTNDIIAGAKFKDRDNPEKGFEIIDKPVYAPTHNKKRRIKKEDAKNICRCQGCQDYTVRMRRREGVDFFIPSTRYPGRKKLKTVKHVAYEP